MVLSRALGPVRLGAHRPLPLGLEEVGDALGGEGDREEDGSSTAAASPASRSAIPTSSTAVAISQTRPRRGGGDGPHRPLAVAAPQFVAARRLGEHLDSALGEPGGGRDGVAEQGQSAEREHGQGGGEHQ